MRGRDGFILLAVLGLMLLLAGLVGAVMLASRSAIGSARVEVDALSGDALLMAGLEIAAHELVGLEIPSASIANQQIRLDGGTVTLFARTDGGKIDLNTSDPVLLAAAFEAAGLKSMPPETFAARVEDWRDEDNDPVEDGAEADDYANAGLAQRPTNSGFRNLSELRYLMGMKAGDIAKLRPYLTVYNPIGTVNLFTAPPEVLNALPDVDERAVRRIIAMRKERDEETAQELLSQFVEAEAYVNADVQEDAVYLVRLDARPTVGRRRTVEAVIIPDPSGALPYRIVDWSELPVRPPDVRNAPPSGADAPQP